MFKETSKLESLVRHCVGRIATPAAPVDLLGGISVVEDLHGVRVGRFKVLSYNVDFTVDLYAIQPTSMNGLYKKNKLWFLFKVVITCADETRTEFQSESLFGYGFDELLLSEDVCCSGSVWSFINNSSGRTSTYTSTEGKVPNQSKCLEEVTPRLDFKSAADFYEIQRRLVEVREAKVRLWAIVKQQKLLFEETGRLRELLHGRMLHLRNEFGGLSTA